MRSISLVPIVAALTAVGCSKHVAGPAPDPLASPVVVTLQERLPERSLVLDVRTVREYECSNYRQQALVARVPQGFRIEFGEVVLTPQVCRRSIGPARSSLELGSLPPGSAELYMHSQLGVVAGRLDVREDRYLMEAPPGPIQFADSELRRIPAGTIWGLFGYARADQEPTARAILDRMQTLGAIFRPLPPGKYSVLLRSQGTDVFRVTANGEIDYGNNQGYNHTLAFARGFEGDLGALRELVAQTGHDFGSQNLSLHVFTWRGELFSSWDVAN